MDAAVYLSLSDDQRLELDGVLAVAQVLATDPTVEAGDKELIVDLLGRVADLVVLPR